MQWYLYLRAERSQADLGRDQRLEIHGRDHE